MRRRRTTGWWQLPLWLVCCGVAACSGDRAGLPTPAGSGPPRLPDAGSAAASAANPIAAASTEDPHGADSVATGDDGPSDDPGVAATTVGEDGALGAPRDPAVDAAAETADEPMRADVAGLVADGPEDPSGGDAPAADEAREVDVASDALPTNAGDAPGAVVGGAASSIGVAGDEVDDAAVADAGSSEAPTVAEATAEAPESEEDRARRDAEEAAARALQEAMAGLSEPAPPPPPAVDHAAFDAILQAAVRGERVDYVAIRDRHAAALKGYLDRLAEVDPTALERDEALAFYFNLYNATMIQAVIDRLTPDWTPAADSFRVFDEPLVRLAARRVSLNQLENEILRKDFQEPRLHVALVCGARSCPPLRDRAYDARTLDATLDENMRSFLASGYRNRIDRRGRTLYLSRIFEWYAADFGGPDGVAAYVDRHVAGDVSDYAVEFIEYHWDLNITR